MKERIIVSGKRKTSVARAEIFKGEGNITINEKPYYNFPFFDRLRIEEPLKITENILGKKEFDVKITVRGGGEKSQIEASRLALARAIDKFTQSEKLKKAFLEYDRNLLVADVRRREAYKPGDSKARSMRQSSKR